MTTDTSVQTLIINKMKKAQYDALTEKDPTQVYVVTDAESGGGSGADNNGLEGDYCSRYGIVDETKSGLITQGVGNQVIVPAQMVMDIPGVPGLTTNSSKIVHDLTSTTNCELFFANGNIIEATDVFFQQEEPEDGNTGFAAWWNGTEWKFKSNDTGNVFRAANAVRVAKCVFTDGSLTRLCFTGCRLLNKQEWLPKSGGNLDPQAIIGLPGKDEISGYRAGIGSSSAFGGTYGAFCIGDRVSKAVWYQFNKINIRPGTDDQYNLGADQYRWRTLYLLNINNGADIAVPTTGGTMVVATPPTDEGTYTLKATVAADGSVTTEWIKDA